MKTKNTKKRFVLSLVVTVVSIAMLVGATFAWFTDSVTSGKNIIKSGNLDVAMYYADGTKEVPTEVGENGWKDASNATIFDYDKWEPGYTQVNHIKIANIGTLALKYKVAIVADGDVGKLAEALDVYAFPEATQVTDRSALLVENKIGTLKEVLENGSLDLTGNLMPAGTEGKTSENTLTIAVKMQEDAGNEYQGLSVGNGFTVVVKATQYTFEEDSFDNKYDIVAPWVGEVADSVPYDEETKTYTVSTGAELAKIAQMVNGGNSLAGETVILAKDIDLNNVPWTPIGKDGAAFNGVFDGDNHTVLNLKASGTKNMGLFGSVFNYGTIKNVNIKNANISGVAYVGVVAGSVYGDVENCHVENATVTANAVKDGIKLVDGAKAGSVVGFLKEGISMKLTNCSAKNVTINGYRDLGGIVGCVYGDNTVTGNTCISVTINQKDLTGYDDGTTNTLGAIYGRIVTNSGGTLQENASDEVTINKAPTVIEVPSEKIPDILIAESSKGKALQLPKNAKEIDMTGKTFADGMTLVGNEGSSIKISTSGAAPSVNANNVVFKNVEFEYGNQTYNAIRGTVTFENCTFNGLVNSYDNSTFINSTFNNIDGQYLAHVYCGTATFNGCTFNGSNRCVYVYTDGFNATAKFENCTFTMTSVDKSAVMLNSRNNGEYYDVTITNCTQTGGNDQGTKSSDGPNYDYRGLYGFKHSPAQVFGKLTVDGVIVYQNPAN